MKVVLLAEIVFDVANLPTSVLIVFLVCLFSIAILVLVNESACDRLNRILRTVLGRSDNTQRRKRK